MPSVRGFLTLLFLGILVLTSSGILPSPVQATFARPRVAVAGDLGDLTTGAGLESLKWLNNNIPSFFLALGDLSYNSSVTGDVWCSEFKSKFRNIEITPGPHDTGAGNVTDTTVTHSYERFVDNCPFTLTQYSVSSPTCADAMGQCYGDYGRQYYFDYPATTPLARFILVSPGIFNITGGCGASCIVDPRLSCDGTHDCWSYSSKDSHYNWTSKVIDDARNEATIKWVIVGMHNSCIAAAKENCGAGSDLFNLLISKKVDLIFTGGDHAYERSKQLRLDPDTCPSLPVRDDSWVDYNPGCLVNTSPTNTAYGPGNAYNRGAGTVEVVAGTFGGDLDPVNDSSVNHGLSAAEAPYFERLMGANTPGSGHGVTWVFISESSIEVDTSFSSTFYDSFIISSFAPTPSFAWSPTNPQVGATITFNGSATGGTTGGLYGYMFTWQFGDGSNQVEPTPALSVLTSHVYTRNQTYDVTLSATDSNNFTRVVDHIIDVKPIRSSGSTSPPSSGPTSSPTTPPPTTTPPTQPKPTQPPTGTTLDIFWLVVVPIAVTVPTAILVLRRARKRGVQSTSYAPS